MSLFSVKLFIGYSLPIGEKSNFLAMAYQTIRYLANPRALCIVIPRDTKIPIILLFKNHIFEDAVPSSWNALLPLFLHSNVPGMLDQ